jgi:hypothetical protein
MTHRPRFPVSTGLLVVLLVCACVPDATRHNATPSPGETTATATPGPTGPTPSPSFVPPTPTPMPTFLVYTVVRGDTLLTIGRRFGTTGRSIAFWNRATYPSLDPDSPRYAPNSIRVGWTLMLIPNVVVNEDDLPEASPGAG